MNDGRLFWKGFSFHDSVGHIFSLLSFTNAMMNGHPFLYLLDRFEHKHIDTYIREDFF
jgi:predicted aldo/keto reductase-like oxidoreductase